MAAAAGRCHAGPVHAGRVGAGRDNAPLVDAGPEHPGGSSVGHGFVNGRIPLAWTAGRARGRRSTAGATGRPGSGSGRPGGKPGVAGRRCGAALLLLVLSLVAMGVGLAVALPRANHDVKRAREAELRFVLGEFRRAAVRFHERVGRWPAGLADLENGPGGQRFLRRVYPDPMTGKADWVVEGDATGGFLVRSASPDRSLAGVPYADWR